MQAVRTKVPLFKDKRRHLFGGDDTGVVICGLGDEIKNCEQL